MDPNPTSQSSKSLSKSVFPFSAYPSATLGAKHPPRRYRPGGGGGCDGFANVQRFTFTSITPIPQVAWSMCPTIRSVGPNGILRSFVSSRTEPVPSVNHQSVPLS